jgi:hypothetical protein
MSELITALTTEEQTDLSRLENVIDTGRETFVKVGEALREINHRRLYRLDYGTFEAYCQERWGFSRQYAYNLISASELSTSGLQISNERAGRVLKGADDPKLIMQVATATSQTAEPTSIWLKATRNVMESAKATGGYVDTGDGEMTALEAAITQEAYEIHQRQIQHMRDRQSEALLSILTSKVTIERGRLIFDIDDLAKAQDFLDYFREHKPKMKLLIYEAKPS